MCSGCLVDITRLMEDCYGLMGLKVTWTDLDWGCCCCCCFGRGQTVSLYSAYWCLWHTMRLTSFRHYYFPQVLFFSMVTQTMWSNFFCKLSFVTATSFDPSTDNKNNSVNIYIFKQEVTPLCQPCYLHCTLDLELKLHTLLDFFLLERFIYIYIN